MANILTITAAEQVNRTVPEGTQTSFLAKYYDSAYTAATPTTARYRVDNPDLCTTITDWASLTASSSMSIDLNGSTLKLTDQCEPRERRRITVQTNAGLATQVTKSIDWYVNNQFGVS